MKDENNDSIYLPYFFLSRFSATLIFWLSSSSIPSSRYPLYDSFPLLLHFHRLPVASPFFLLPILFNLPPPPFHTHLFLSLLHRPFPPSLFTLLLHLLHSTQFFLYPSFTPLCPLFPSPNSLRSSSSFSYSSFSPPLYPSFLSSLFFFLCSPLPVLSLLNFYSSFFPLLLSLFFLLSKFNLPCVAWFGKTIWVNVCEIFRDEHSKKVKNFMLDIMSTLLSETDAVPQELLDIMLENIINPKNVC